MRKRIYEIIDRAHEDDIVSTFYDYSMIIIIIASLVPLTFKLQTPFLKILDKITISIFILDYLLRLCTADYKFQKKGIMSFIRYPFSFMAIIDLISILPSFIMINPGFTAFRILRMLQSARVLRILRLARYSKSIMVAYNVFKSSRDSLIATGVLAAGYIFIAALIIFNVEPETFENFFEAIYWATISLTTVGYGDIYPISTIGRVIAMISSIFGIAIVALPAGVITAGYMNAINEKVKPKTDNSEESKNTDEEDSSQISC